MRAKAAKPSSHATIVPSRLSSSLSLATRCSCSSTTTACEGDETLRQSTSKSQHHDKEASPGERRHRVKADLTSGEAQLEEASALPRWDGNWQRSRRGLPLYEHLPSSSSLTKAIAGNRAGRASGSMAGKGDFGPNSQNIKRIR
jgi:hypothetical protein